MGDILILTTQQGSQYERACVLWRVYSSARDRAEKTRDLADGIAAGKAWAAFLKEFEPLKT